MKKKLLSLGLALVMCLSLTVPALAADDPEFWWWDDPGNSRYVVTRTGEGSFVEEKNTVYIHDAEGPIPYEISGYYQITPDTSWTVTDTGTSKEEYFSICVEPFYKDEDGYRQAWTDITMNPRVVLTNNGDFGRIENEDVRDNIKKLSPGESVTFTWANVKAALDTISYLRDIKKDVLYVMSIQSTGCVYYVYAVSGSVSGAPVTVGGFTDVKSGDYFADPVLWAVEKGITAGTTKTTFSPTQNCTVAQILTFLWRANGSPKAAGNNPFSDVKAGDYFYDAALWAAEKGMVSGGTFNGSAPCTRSMAVTYMWKAVGSPSAKASSFTDVSAGASYAGAVAWAVEQGVTAGTTAATFSPDNVCTRGQIVTFLYRGLKK